MFGAPPDQEAASLAQDYFTNGALCIVPESFLKLGGVLGTALFFLPSIPLHPLDLTGLREGGTGGEKK